MLRMLLDHELDKVAGATYSGETVVYGPRPTLDWSMPDPYPYKPNPSGSGYIPSTGGGTYGPGVPSGNDPARTSVDRSDLSPASSIDLSSVTVERITLGNHNIDVVVDLKTLPLNSDARNSAISIMWNFNMAYNNLSQSAKDAVSNLDYIVLGDFPVRSFSEESKGAFYFDYSEIISGTPEFAASNILHDANHISIYEQTHNYELSRGTASEISGWQMQLDNADAYNLSTRERDYLKSLIADPNSQGTRVNTPPY